VADRLQVLEDCLTWLGIERNDATTHALPRAACEARFGRPHPGEEASALSRDEPMELQLDGRRLRYAGRIDRVTWDADPPTRFRVVDYKTGGVYGERHAELQGGRMLQLPLYVLAAAQLLGVDPSAGEARYVYPTRRGNFKQIGWDAAELSARHGEVLALLDAMLEAMSRGDFMIAPWKEDACRICDLNAVCPLPRAAYVERKAGDRRLARFTREIRIVQ
jgi:RecB family exonuclease